MFNENYYQKIMKENNYDPLKFQKINFSLGKLSEKNIKQKWLCHHNGEKFSKKINISKCIVSTGFGLSGTPHLGTLSQILKAISLQKAGIPVQIVLGDLDAYNGKGTELEKAKKLAKKYEKFILRLGFKKDNKSILRSQYESLEVLRTSYLIGYYMDDEMFNQSEEDLHSFYHKKGKVDKEMSYRRKLSLNLMTADFIDLNINNKFEYILVMLGIDEHKYVKFAQKTLENIKKEKKIKNFKLEISALYSSIIKGFYNYPKMSKSFPESGINLDMKNKEIKKRIFEGEGEYDLPENNVIYQMIASASRFTSKEINNAYEACKNKDPNWQKIKEKYYKEFIEIKKLWKEK